MAASTSLTLLTILLISLVHLTLSAPPPTEFLVSRTKKHFVLVHGAGHGAWCWYKIVPLLRSSGHNVTVFDLAASGVDLRQAKFLQSASDYHRPLLDFMESLPQEEKVILVGHSLGGLAVSQAMERFPTKISVAVFLVAFMPGPQLNVSTIMEKAVAAIPLLDTTFAYDNGPNNPPTTVLFGPLFLRSIFYVLSPIEDWTLATTLIRPVAAFFLLNLEPLSKEIVLTNKNYGSVKRVFIITEKDKSIDKENIQLWMIKGNPPNEVREIPGADHVVMMSKPTEVFTHLLQIATEYDVDEY